MRREGERGWMRGVFNLWSSVGRRVGWGSLNSEIVSEEGCEGVLGMVK